MDLAIVVFCCQLPQSVGRMERIFTSETSPGIHSISSLLLFTRLYDNWFSKLSFCEWNMWVQPRCNWVHYRNLKYWAVSPEFLYLIFILINWFICQCSSLALLLFSCKLIIISLTVFILLLPYPLSSGPWRRQRRLNWSQPLVCPYFSNIPWILLSKIPLANYSLH